MEVAMKRSGVVAFAAVLVVLALGPPARAAEEKKQQKKAAPAKKAASKPGEAAAKEPGKKLVLNEPAVFTMEESPAFGKDDAPGMVRYRYPQGQYGACSTTPNREVKSYPKLKSNRPLYGSVTFDSSYYDPKPGVTYHFVFDESGETAKDAEADKAKAAPPAKTEKKAGETKKNVVASGGAQQEPGSRCTARGGLSHGTGAQVYLRPALLRSQRRPRPDQRRGDHRGREAGL
jgi:hypothetical protein